MKIICVIPARYQSVRLPGKPLAAIGSAPMIEWVYRRAAAVGVFDQVLVATDDDRIKKTVTGFGGNAMITPSDLPSGTDRVAYVAKSVPADVYVNLQGDEPLITPSVLEHVCRPFESPDVNMTTPVAQVESPDELTDPNKVRVVLDKNGDALYFTRAVVPFNRKERDTGRWLDHHLYYRHIGIYAYRASFLRLITGLPQGRLENIEKLEQLRVLENGFKIRTVVTSYRTFNVDTSDDLQLVNKYVEERGIKPEDVYVEM